MSSSLNDFAPHTQVASSAMQGAILNHAPCAIVTTTTCGQLLHCNPAAELLLARNASELIGQCNLLELIPAQEIQKRATILSEELGRPFSLNFEVLAAKVGIDQPDQFECSLRRPDGSTLPVTLKIAAVDGDHQDVVGYLIIAEPLTNPEDLDAQSRSREEAYRSLFDAVPSGVFVCNLDSVILHYNRRAAEIWGREPKCGVDHYFGFSIPAPPDACLMPHMKDPIGDALRRGKPLQHLEVLLEQPNGSHIPAIVSCQPLRDSQGHLTGSVISFDDITQQKLSEAKFAAAALTDALTGLPNRALLLDRLRGTVGRAKRRGMNFAVMFLDFDRFKEVNDGLGHDVGDELLRQIAGRLQNELRGLDTVARRAEDCTAARLGGDEFVILLEELAAPEDAIIVAERLLKVLKTPYQLGRHEVYSTASIGLVLGHSAYERAEDVLRDADTAMYEAKHAGKACYVIFDERMHTKVQRRLKIQNCLHAAIGTNQLSLHYQPIISFANGQISSVEGLLRWEHPELGRVSPGEFIPIAQDSDLILKLGEWVLREGCRQAVEWTKTLGPLAPPMISLNLSRKQFADPQLLPNISAILEETQLPANRLQLEITEDAYAMNMEDAVSKMKQMKSLGVKLAIDDFGSGTSSFVALHQFPVDVLKLDRSLLSQIEQSVGEAALLRGLVVMARNLGIELVAEGIELAKQARAVQELGCQYMQGYYFAKPMPAADLVALILDNSNLVCSAAGAMTFAGRWADRMSYMEHEI